MYHEIILLVLVDKWQRVKLGNNIKRVWQNSSDFPSLGEGH